MTDAKKQKYRDDVFRWSVKNIRRRWSLFMIGELIKSVNYDTDKSKNILKRCDGLLTLAEARVKYGLARNISIAQLKSLGVSPEIVVSKTNFYNQRSFNK